MVAVLRLCRWGRLFSGSVRGGACGPMGVPGAGGPGRCVCRWAAARPLAVRAASCCLLPRQISGRRAACPPARRPRCELRSARRLEARPGPAGLAAASNRSGCLCVAWPVPAASLISHVIPTRVFQTMNTGHWNCNVFGCSLKNDRWELCATFGGRRPRATQPHHRTRPPRGSVSQDQSQFSSAT